MEIASWVLQYLQESIRTCVRCHLHPVRTGLSRFICKIFGPLHEAAGFTVGRTVAVLRRCFGPARTIIVPGSSAFCCLRQWVCMMCRVTENDALVKLVRNAELYALRRSPNLKSFSEHCSFSINYWAIWHGYSSLGRCNEMKA